MSEPPRQQPPADRPDRHPHRTRTGRERGQAQTVERRRGSDSDVGGDFVGHTVPAHDGPGRSVVVPDRAVTAGVVAALLASATPANLTDDVECPRIEDQCFICPAAAEPDRAEHHLGSTGITAAEVDSARHACRTRVDPVEGLSGRGPEPDAAKAGGQTVDRRGAGETDPVRNPSGVSVDAQQLVVECTMNDDPDGAVADRDRTRFARQSVLAFPAKPREHSREIGPAAAVCADEPGTGEISDKSRPPGGMWIVRRREECRRVADGVG